VRWLVHALPIGKVETMEGRVLAMAAAPRLLMFVLTAFAAVTGMLAAIGVYGLLACVVNERRRELAIRLALGAKPAALAGLVTRQGMVLATVGIVIGLGSAQLAGRLLEGVLFQTRTSDVVALTTTGGLLLVAALVACLAPARRAARVAPIEGLRADV
jgi:ABC-type antimicrobial peptide transport system permease subunit